MLSGQWRAPLVALHVLEPDAEMRSWYEARGLPSWRRPPDPHQVAERQLRASLREPAEHVTTLVEEGDPAEVITRVAVGRQCDLVVTGTARGEALGRLFVGTTVDRLVRRSPVPVLTVKLRARAPYRNVVVATDFSESSRLALAAALRWFGPSPVTLFNAYEAPQSGFAPDHRRYQEEYRKVIAEECAAFLDAAPLPPEVRRQISIVLEHGRPQRLLPDYVVDRDVDLVVVGSQGRSAVLEVLLGSVARDLLAAVSCDVLVVREPRATHAG